LNVSPLVYLFVQFFIDSRIRFRAKDLIHAVPSIIAVMLSVLVIYSRTTGYRDECMLIPGKITSYFLITIGINIFVILQLVFYVILFLYKNQFLWKNRENFSRAKLGSIFIFLIIIYAAVLAVSFSIKCLYMYYVILIPGPYGLSFFKMYIRGLALASSAIIVLYLFEKRYPNYYQIFRKTFKLIRYERSRINGIDVDAVLDSLKTLMSEKKIYTDENINLNEISKQLSIAPYQLTQILNERLKKNFNTYINEYRIKEAQKILLEDKERTILSISLDVGFNSTSIFYTWFVRISGCSPSQFRKKNK
jgi:AraC-like DNA-binding protein